MNKDLIKTTYTIIIPKDKSSSDHARDNIKKIQKERLKQEYETHQRELEDIK